MKSLSQILTSDRITNQKGRSPQQLVLFPPKDDPPRYPLQIVAIPESQRIAPDWFCGLIHYESRFKLGGQFTHEEAKEILETTRYWNFSLDKNPIPKCADRLLVLLESICDRQLSESREVAK